MWFNDNRKYNRRAGVLLDLNQGSSVEEFVFNSQTDAENAFNDANGFYAPHNHLLFSEVSYPDPETIPMWPKLELLKEIFGSAGSKKRLWHTTEIHTYFQYQKTEKFAFAGDDDVWVYINGRLAVDLGGVHSEAQQSIDLSRDAAAEHFNLTVGETYTFDMFQAERRSTDSNFKLTTTLASPCNAANELNSKKQFEASSDLLPENVKVSRNVQINPDGSFLLTRSGAPHSTSYMFVKEPINVGTGFVINFDVNLTSRTEGFAFILHRRPEGLSNLPRSGGSNLGFKGFTNSLAVAFDLCEDRDVPGNSCKEQRVSVHYPEKSEKNDPSERTLKVRDSIMLGLNDGAIHHVKLDYFVVPPAMEVTIDGSLYLRVLPINPIEIFDSEAAYAGFTATAGDDADADLTIANFTVFTVDVESSQTLTVDFPEDVTNFTRKSVVADNVQSDGFWIQTRDGCEGLIGYGGRTSNTRGLFVERVDPVTGFYHNGSLTPNMIEAVIEDDGQGRYKYALQTASLGQYSLYLYYGNAAISCGFDIETTTSVVHGKALDIVSVNLTGHTNCYFNSILDAVEMVPLTDAPTASPTAFVPLTPKDDGTAALIGGIGGGAFAVVAGLAALAAVYYRRKWNKDKQFIASGLEYGKEAKREYTNNDRFGAAGRELLAIRAAILRRRAQRGGDMAALSKLETEQEELTDQIDRLKKKFQSRHTELLESIPASTRRAHEKMEF